MRIFNEVEAIVLVHDGGRILRVSRGAIREFRAQSAEELKSKGFAELVATESWEVSLDRMIRMLGNSPPNQMPEIEIVFRRLDGTTFRARVNTLRAMWLEELIWRRRIYRTVLTVISDGAD